MNTYMHTSNRKHDYIRIHTNIYVISYTIILSYIYIYEHSNTLNSTLERYIY